MDAAIAGIGHLQRERKRLYLEKDERLAEVNRAFETQKKPLEDDIKRLREGIQAWCESRRRDLTGGGKVKFHDFPAGKISWRMRPARVVLRSIENVIQALRERKLERFVRIKEEVNKEAILAEPEAVSGIPGIKLEQGEEFIVTPFETDMGEVA
ncbi:MAG: host-nuclease inhibitor Gam family protein [Magnetococcales bacterium]|nr:host-nuclease inhibitor Gam family protein [Magnetococcales bacterium]